MISYIVFLSVVHSVLSARILIMAPVTTISEARLFHTTAKDLVSRGHVITLVTSHLITPPIKKLTQIVTTRPLVLNDLILEKNLDLVKQRELGKDKLKFILTYDDSFITDRCHETFQNKEFESLILSKTKGEFDLLVTGAFVHHCFFGLAQKFEIPIVLISCMPLPQMYSISSGFWDPTSFVPFSIIMKATDRMTFSERLLNTLTVWTVILQEEYVMKPKFTALYRQYLGDHYSSVNEIERNISLILSNSHFALHFPKPWLPDVQEIGGVHCHKPEKLSNEIQNFISKGKHGFIYFSMGTVSSSTTMPEYMRKIFVKVFGKLKQRVLWKWSDDTMKDLPENVMISKWFPQQDLLGHKDIRLFITHGGAFSTIEAAYHDCPIIGLPIFMDQDVNMFQMEHAGFAINLEFSELTEEILESNIHKVLEDPKYKENSRRVSSILQDHPIHPLNRTSYYIEYVLRHKGALHLRSAARDLNFIQVHAFDVVAVLLLILIAIVSLLFFLLVAICRKILLIRESYKTTPKRKQN